MWEPSDFIIIIIIINLSFVLVLFMFLKVAAQNCNTLGIEHNCYCLKVPLMYYCHFVMDQYQFMSIFQDIDKCYSLQIK